MFVSVVRMEPSGTDVHPPQEAAINGLTGIFLKSVFFLDSELAKCVVVGIFKNRDNSLGVLFSGKKKTVFFSYDLYNQLSVHFDEISLALKENRKKFVIKLDGGGRVKVRPVFAIPHVVLYGKDGGTLALSHVEWAQFVNTIPQVNRCLRDLFLNEVEIKDFLRHTLDLQQDQWVYIETQLQCPVTDRLIDEINCYKASG